MLKPWYGLVYVIERLGQDVTITFSVSSSIRPWTNEMLLMIWIRWWLQYSSLKVTGDEFILWIAGAFIFLSCKFAESSPFAWTGGGIQIPCTRSRPPRYIQLLGTSKARDFLIFCCPRLEHKCKFQTLPTAMVEPATYMLVNVNNNAMVCTYFEWVTSSKTSIKRTKFRCVSRTCSSCLRSPESDCMCMLPNNLPDLVVHQLTESNFSLIPRFLVVDVSKEQSDLVAIWRRLGSTSWQNEVLAKNGHQ